MASNVPSTRSARALDAILRALLLEYQATDLDETTTGHRIHVRDRINQLKAAISLVPVIEADTAVLLLLGCTPEQARDRLAFAAGVPMAAVA